MTSRRLAQQTREGAPAVVTDLPAKELRPCLDPGSWGFVGGVGTEEGGQAPDVEINEETCRTIWEEAAIGSETTQY